MGPSNKAAELETQLIDRYIDHQRNLNLKRGGEGAVKGVWTFVYALENSFTEFDEIHKAKARANQHNAAHQASLRHARKPAKQVRALAFAK